MYKVIGSGGLGDAVIILSQTLSLYENDDFELTHVMKNPTLLESVKEFYDSQNINSVVKKINNFDWIQKNKKDFDFHAKIIKNPDWEIINPFPKYKVDEAKKFDILISPTAGRDNDRSFTKKEIMLFCERNYDKKIGLIGKTNNIYLNTNVITNVVNLINKTSISETLNLINESSIVIAPAGFISIIANSMNKQVFTKDHNQKELIRRTYYHPKWKKNKFIDNLNQIKKC